MKSIEKEYIEYQELVSQYREEKRKEFTKCNHIWIISQVSTNKNICSCMKCNLSEMVLNKELSSLTLDEQVMFEYFKDYQTKNPHKIKGMRTNIICDKDLSHAIYLKIHEKYPHLPNPTLLKYFDIALTDIRNIQVNEERKRSRIKRLHLDPNFNNWNSSNKSSK